MRFSTRFYRAAALCSFASVITTMGLIFLPRLYLPVADFDARMALSAHPAYVLRSWIYLVHPFLVMTVALAVAARCRARAAGSASLGLLGFGLWAASEAAQQALTLVALDRTWRAAWPQADDAARQLIRSHVAFYDALWDALYLLLLLGFLGGNVFLGLAIRPADRLERWVRAAYWAAAGLTLIILLPEVGGPTPPPGATAWLYPLVQPAGRALTGWWLWRDAGRAEEPAPPA